MLKACAKESHERFETAEEFLLALERGETRPLNRPRRQPLLQRHGAPAFRALLALSLAANLVLLLLLLLAR